MTNFEIGNLVKVTNEDRAAFGRVILLSLSHTSPSGNFFRMCCNGNHYNFPLFRDPRGDRNYCPCELSFLYTSPSSVPLEEVASLIFQLDESSFPSVISEIKANLEGQTP